MRSLIILVVVQFWVVFTLFSQAKNCTLKVQWMILDHHEDQPLEFATLFIEEINKALVTDSLGMIQLSGLCPGFYHVAIQHFGCETRKEFIEINQDTLIKSYLEHHQYTLHPVIIEGSHNKQVTTQRNDLQQIDLRGKTDKPLAILLESVAGVSVQKNGSNISSPVIQGLSGNRISLLHAGMIHAGQQWGSDHAPEIDPFSANVLTLIKGVDAIPYGGNGLGGLVLMEPGPILQDPHLHGTLQSIYRTNGRSIHLGFKTEQSAHKWDWRISGSAKLTGDHYTPSYFLTNTGSQDASFSALVIRKSKLNSFIKLYYSFFYTQPGILRGSHIGNLSDLQRAIDQSVPFYTKDNFSYSIEAPHQKVRHHFLKGSFQSEKNGVLQDLSVGLQWNQREEYDVRRGGRSDIPALDLHLLTGQILYQQQRTWGNTHWVYGFSHQSQVNQSNKQTGIIALIPDYFQHAPGIFFTTHSTTHQWQWEAGMRYDVRFLKVDYIQRGFPNTLQEISKNFSNFSVAGGFHWMITDHFQLTSNLGWTDRAPHVNELFSNGLHQSVAGIEEGDQNLNKETSIKLQLGLRILVENWIHLECVSWTQHIQNFIFLEPQKEPRLTIRGAFPVYLYKQTDAVLRGVDFQCKMEFSPTCQLNLKSSFLHSNDENGQAITGMPPHQISGTLHYLVTFKNKIRKLDFYGSPSYHFKQKRYNINNDLLAPPPDYLIFSGGIEVESFILRNQCYFGVNVENAFNKKYRDYLNKLRYFADEEGRSISMFIRIEF